MKACYILVSAWALFVSPLAIDKSEKPTDDLAALQGEWKVWFSADDYLLFAVDGDSFTMTRHAAERASVPWEGLMTVDETANPKQLTWTDVKCGGQGLPDNLCIYELHGDTWILIGGGAAKRPERFVPSETWVLKRERAKE
jgi:uncharacterized protein (TIGR03067 family)